jgi:predicted metal-dependent peptidase
MSNVTTSEKTKKIKTKEFSQNEKNKIIEKLITARIGLLLRHPFFGNLATRLELVDASDWCATLATDGRKFYYNNEFVNRLTPKETEFGFAHEVLHNVFDHMGRRGDRDHTLSNIAADYAVNQILKDEKIGHVPSWIKIYQDNKYRSWAYEKIYEDIEKNSVKIDLESLGELFDEHLDGDDETDGNGDSSATSGNGKPKLTAEEKKKIRDEIKEALISAAQTAGAGKVPAAIDRMIKDFTQPKMNWRELIRMNVQSIIKNNFSFSRPNRKSQHSGAVLPGLMNEETIDIAVALDMSGSIGDMQANDMISEVKGLIDEYNDFKLRLWCFDTNVYNYAEFTKDTSEDINSYQIKGGGGTDFDCNWSFMKENDINPKKFIMFTDGYPYNSWGDPNYCDTLFVIHGNDKIVSPFGQTTYYK